MRKFIKKLQEIDNGTMRLINDKELAELKEFVEHNGFMIRTENDSVGLDENSEEHKLDFQLTEHDAVKIFKAINPITFSRRTPKEKHAKPQKPQGKANKR